jgi:hypothetical protein
MLDDTDVGSLASGVGCDHVLAVLEADLSSGELSSDAMCIRRANVPLVRLPFAPQRLTNAYRVHWIDLSKSKCARESDGEACGGTGFISCRSYACPASP